MTQATSAHPTNPADIEAAALALICGVPDAVISEDALMRGCLQDIAGLCQLEGVFTKLAWPDANRVALAVVLDAVNSKDAAVSLRDRAQLLLSGRDEVMWVDPAEVVRALNVAARVLDM